MRPRAARYLLCLPVLIGLSLFPADLRVGRAKVVITPPLGAAMGSSYGLTPAKSVADDLHAKALVLESGGVKAALVACDLISIQKSLVAGARRLIEQRTGLRGNQVILSATHCHAGPQMHPLFLALAGGPAEQLGKQYVADLPGHIAEAVRLAEADLQPARASAAVVHEDAVVFNRRFLLQDGTVRMNPGRLNPAIVRPVGPVDPDLSVVYFETPSGQALASFVNYALHVAIVGGSQISADYPGYLSRYLAAVKGPGMLTLFTNGMSGNINHLDVSDPKPLSGHAASARVGAILAAGVLRAYQQLQPIGPARLRSRTEKVLLPTPEFTPAEVERARATFSRYGKPGAPSFDEVVHAWKVLDVAELGGAPLETEVQVIALGDELGWVGMPGDAFVELGLGVKANSPFPFTIVSEQSGSGAISYVPNRKAFPEGAYEVISARFSPGGAERLVDAAVRLLLEMRP
jgi:hypothetical protein